MRFIACGTVFQMCAFGSARETDDSRFMQFRIRGNHVKSDCDSSCRQEDSFGIDENRQGRRFKRLCAAVLLSAWPVAGRGGALIGTSSWQAPENESPGRNFQE